MTTVLALCPNCNRRHNATNPPAPPNEKQVAAHKWIGEFMAAHAWPPTMQNIADHFGVKHVTAWGWCNALEDCGLLVRTKGGHKKIVKVLPIPAGVKQ